MAAKETMVNIPRSNTDKFYRYQMPLLRAKVEGKGNGIKTVIENMAEIAKALERPVEYPVKFFGFEFGALTKADAANNKYIVNGKHDVSALLESLDKFIQKYVLCAGCGNPETELKVKGETIDARCRACGKTSKIDMSHKLSTYILKNPPVDKEKDAQKAAAAAARQKGGKQDQSKVMPKTTQPEEDEVEWSVDTSPAAVEQRRRDLLGNRDRLSQKDGEGEAEDEEGKPKGPAVEIVTEGVDPVTALVTFFKTEPNQDDCLAAVKNASTKAQWSETNLYKFIYAALFDPKNMRQDFYKKTNILGWFVTSSKHQKIVLYCLEKQCEQEKALIPQLPHILNGFYEEGVLDQDTLSKWHKAASAALKDQKVVALIKEKSKPFIEWLEATPEEQSSEDASV